MMFNLHNKYISVDHSKLTSCQAPSEEQPVLHQHDLETNARLKHHAEVAGFKGVEVVGFGT